MIVKMRKDVKPVVVIEQNGKDFVYTIKTPMFTRVYSFTLGQETEIPSVDGRKVKVGPKNLMHNFSKTNFLLVSMELKWRKNTLVTLEFMH